MARYVDADARVLRAAAHPTRAAIAYELYARGEGTASSLASAIGEPVNSVSFHLRRLAHYGLVEEVANRSGDGRQRWWRMTPEEGLVIDTERISREPGGDAALRVRRRHAVGWWHALIERYFGAQRPDGEVWQINDVPMLLTAAEAEEMAEEVRDAMSRWQAIGKERASAVDPAERHTYLGMSVVMPHQPDLARDYPADQQSPTEAASADEVGDDESVGGAA